MFFDVFDTLSCLIVRRLVGEQLRSFPCGVVPREEHGVTESALVWLVFGGHERRESMTHEIPHFPWNKLHV